MEIFFALCGFGILYCVLTLVDGIADAQYGHRFLSKSAFFAMGLGTICLVLPLWHALYGLKLKPRGFSEDIVLLLIVGSVLVSGSILHNIYRTTFLLGVSGSVLQIALFGMGFISWVAWLLWLLFWSMFSGCLEASIEPSDPIEEWYLSSQNMVGPNYDDSHIKSREQS